jgi:hypothetical protein
MTDDIGSAVVVRGDEAKIGHILNIPTHGRFGRLLPVAGIKTRIATASSAKRSRKGIRIIPTLYHPPPPLSLSHEHWSSEPVPEQGTEMTSSLMSIWYHPACGRWTIPNHGLCRLKKIICQNDWNGDRTTLHSMKTGGEKECRVKNVLFGHTNERPNWRTMQNRSLLFV